MWIHFPYHRATRCPKVMLITLAFTFPACSAPLAPDAVAPAPFVASGSPFAANEPVTPASIQRTVVTFPLQNGTFTLTLRAADGSTGTVSGSYTGEAVAAEPGNTNATLDLHILQTSGAGSSITGLQDEGTGSFVGEGDFTLSLGLMSSAIKSPDVLKATFKGSSHISCNTTSHVIVVTQHGTDSTPKFPELTIDLQHEVGQTSC